MINVNSAFVKIVLLITVEINMKFEEFESDVLSVFKAVINTEGFIEVDVPGTQKTVSIISTVELESLQECLHILGSLENANALFQSIQELKEGNLKPQTIVELFAEIENE